MRIYRPSILSYFIIAFLLTGCSAKPKLLPNPHLIAVGKGQSEKDIQECIELADAYSDNSAVYKEAAIETTKGAVIGSAAGAVGGAIAGSVGRGTAIGAASGAVAALLNELFTIGEKDPTYRQFAEYCLSKKGYEVGGWR